MTPKILANPSSADTDNLHPSRRPIRPQLVPLAGRTMGPRLPSKDAITVAIGVVLANVACCGTALGIVSRYRRESADLGAYKFDDPTIA
jgi:hypothetical protein